MKKILKTEIKDYIFSGVTFALFFGILYWSMIATIFGFIVGCISMHRFCIDEEKLKLKHKAEMEEF